MSPAAPFGSMQLDLFDASPARAFGGGLRVPAFRGLAAWLAEIDRQGALMRPRRALYERFDRTARMLTPERLRAARDAVALAVVVARLKAARLPWGHDLHGLDRVWSRAELGVLITEAVNRGRQLALGRVTARVKGPALEPARLPDDRLEHLIQHHRDLAVVEALRAERRRREGGARPEGRGPGKEGKGFAGTKREDREVVSRRLQNQGD